MWRELSIRHGKSPHRMGSMVSPIPLTFKYSEQDYVQAMRAHYASRLKLRLDAVVAAASALVGIYLSRFPDMRVWGFVLICLSAVLVVMLFLAFVVIPRVVFRREPKFRDEYSLTFSSDGIHFRTVHINSQLEWSLYTRVLVGAHSLVLYHGNNSFTVIPKRVFESAEQLAAFERLIKENIPEARTKAA
ncbi:MAG: YcxB family protein [Candidatus Acidiferrales bacterium]